jgi:cathepsin L
MTTYVAARLYLSTGFFFSTAVALGLKQQSVMTTELYECGSRLTPFSEFVQQFGRTYEVGSEEYMMREAIFRNRTEAGRKHNCDDERLWKAGINHLSDWTDSELYVLFGHKGGSRRSQSAAIVERDSAVLASVRDSVVGQGVTEPSMFPREFAWSNLTSIQETWDQGNCGSCWAVAATSVMRAHAELKGLPRQFSASQVIACTPNPNACGGTGGCEGATAELAYEYVLRAGVSAGDAAFFAMGGGQMRCPAQTQVPTEKTTDGIVEADGREVHMISSKDRKGMRGREIGMTGWTKLPENKENPILHALVDQGPLYVAVAAGSGWFSYAEGVLTPSGCDTRNVVNHAVVLFGFGVKPHTRIGDVKYWHIKNSWGRGWGEDGAIRLQRQDDEEGFCGWDHSPQEGSGCKDGPPKVWVCGTCGILYDAVVPSFVS